MLLLARGAPKRATGAPPTTSPARSTTSFRLAPTFSDQSLGIRDDYTSRSPGLPGPSALDRLNRPADALGMFSATPAADARCRSQSKGIYWAGRAALAAGQAQTANSYFHGGGRASGTVLRPARARAARAPGPRAAARDADISSARPSAPAFNSRGLVRRRACSASRAAATEQALFVRALAESLTNDATALLAIELGDAASGGQDLAVWTPARRANKGSAFYVRQAYPTLPARRRAGCGRWPTASRARKARSTAPRSATPARAGLMQLMPGTAREQAGKMGVGYDNARLTSDPLQCDARRGLFPAHAQHLGRQRPARRRRATTPAPAMSANGSAIMATRAGRRRHAAVDRGDPVHRDQAATSSG